MYNIMLVSLGCDKNTADSERMLGILKNRGYGLTSDPEECDIAIVNTCCFIQSATEESISNLFELSELKKGRMKYLICAGCMAERFKDQMEENFPEVDAFVGTMSFDSIADVIDELIAKDESVSPEEAESILDFEPLDKGYNDRTDVERVLTDKPYMGYLKIADGCDKRCTYCAIPYFKGKFKSIPKESLIREAKQLTANGVKELIIVAQETTCYGIDLYGEKQLHILLKELSQIEELEWIRLLYCYPEEIYPELIEEMKTNPKVLHYIDMPIQHTESEILRRMGRRIDNEGIRRVVETLRKEIPDIAIRTTIITGFPGETEELHAALMKSVEELEFNHLGVFTYSCEEGTPAATFPDQVDEEVKARRLDEIMRLQMDISAKKLSENIGRNLDVIVEGYLPEDDVYAGRSYIDAPDVDGLVFFESDRELVSGEMVNLEITDTNEYDMEGRVNESSK